MYTNYVNKYFSHTQNSPFSKYCFGVFFLIFLLSLFTSRVVIPTTGSIVITTVHGPRLTAGKVEARLCDRYAGSRGAVFLRLNRVTLEQGGTGGRGDFAKEALPEEGTPCERPRGHQEARKRPRGGGSSSGAKDSESNFLGAGGIERIGKAGRVVREKSAADELETGFDSELEDGSGGGGGDSRCRVVATDRGFWEGERVKLSKSESSADGGVIISTARIKAIAAVGGGAIAVAAAAPRVSIRSLTQKSFSNALRHHRLRLRQQNAAHSSGTPTVKSFPAHHLFSSWATPMPPAWRLTSREASAPVTPRSRSCGRRPRASGPRAAGFRRTSTSCRARNS